LNKEIKHYGKIIIDKLVQKKQLEFKTKKYVLTKELFTYKTEMFKALTEALQMLKVTKDLQNKLSYIDIKTDDNSMNINQMIEFKKKQNLELQMEKYETQMNKKALTQAKDSSKVESEINKLKKEKSKLENELNEFENKLNTFNKIKLTENDENKTNDKRIKDVARKRRMIEQMKAYQEEIDFLKQELEKLRAKTFPNFSLSKK